MMGGRTQSAAIWICQTLMSQLSKCNRSSLADTEISSSHTISAWQVNPLLMGGQSTPRRQTLLYKQLKSHFHIRNMSPLTQSQSRCIVLISLFKRGKIIDCDFLHFRAFFFVRESVCGNELIILTL